VPDNVGVVDGAATYTAATDKLTYSGDTADIQLVRIVHVSGAEGAKSLSEIVGTAGSPGTAVITMQGVGSGTPVIVSNGGTFATQNTPARASTATTTTVAASASSVTLKASNANRRALLVRNASTVTLYVEFGATATSSSFFEVAAGETLREEIYSGIVTGIWESATGDGAIVMEIT
jgi:hypothetical protein